MRWVQSLRAGLSGGRLHRDGAAREWVGVGELGGAGEGGAHDGYVDGRYTAIGSVGSL